MEDIDAQLKNEFRRLRNGGLDSEIKIELVKLFNKEMCLDFISGYAERTKSQHIHKQVYSFLQNNSNTVVIFKYSKYVRLQFKRFARHGVLVENR